MARLLYGATSGDYTMTAGGRVIPNAEIEIWDAIEGGNQITDLTDYDGNPVTVVTSGSDGLVRFYGPDGENDNLWMDTRQGSRLLVRPTVLTASIGDGSILDEDIAADADIDRSKIAGTALTTGSTGVFSVLDFGAVGDGTTDDTAAIQAAIDSFGYGWAGSVLNTTYAQRGGLVYFPPGDYRITSRLRLAPNITLRGAGKIGFYGRNAASDAIDNSVIIVDYADPGGYAVDTSPYQAGGTRVDGAVSYGNSVHTSALSSINSVVIRDLTFVCKSQNSVRLFNLAASEQFVVDNVASYGFLVSMRVTATWRSVVRDSQFYSGFRGAELMHSINNLVFDNVTFSRLGMTAVDTQAANLSDPALEGLPDYAWKDSAGILCYDGATVTGHGITVEGFDRTVVAATHSNVDIRSLWVETSKVLVTNDYSVIDLCVNKLLYGDVLIDVTNGHTTLRNISYNVNQIPASTDYTSVLGSLGVADISRTALIDFPPKVAGDSTGNLHMIYKSETVVEQRGTWTPTLEFGGSSAGTQSSTGYYYRVGDLLYASFYITCATKSGATGAATISGLPLPSKDNFGHAGSGSVTFGYAAPVAGQALMVDANSSVISIPGKTDTHFSNGLDIRGTVVFTVGSN